MKKIFLFLVTLLPLSILGMKKPETPSATPSSSSQAAAIFSASSPSSASSASQLSVPAPAATVDKDKIEHTLSHGSLNDILRMIRSMPDAVSVLTKIENFKRPLIIDAAWNRDPKVLQFVLGLLTPEKRLEAIRGKTFQITEKALREYFRAKREHAFDGCMLHLAAEFNPNPWIMQFLLNQIPQNELADLLFETGMEKMTLFLHALQTNTLQIARMIWNRMPPLKRSEQLFPIKDYLGRTALHLIAETPSSSKSNFAKAIRFVLSNIPPEKRDEALNEPDEDGNTPLHRAAQWCVNRAISELILCGANPGLKNKKGLTAYEVIGKHVKHIIGEHALVETRAVFKKALVQEALKAIAERQEPLKRQRASQQAPPPAAAMLQTATSSSSRTAAVISVSAPATSASTASSAAAVSGWSEPVGLNASQISTPSAKARPKLTASAASTLTAVLALSASSGASSIAR